MIVFFDIFYIRAWAAGFEMFFCVKALTSDWAIPIIDSIDRRKSEDVTATRIKNFQSLLVNRFGGLTPPVIPLMSLATCALLSNRGRLANKGKQNQVAHITNEVLEMCGHTSPAQRLFRDSSLICVINHSSCTNVQIPACNLYIRAISCLMLC